MENINISLPFWETALRLLIAVSCGGIIGIEREKKHRAAGFRTHMIVCVGAALTMILSTYLTVMISSIWSSSNPTINLSTDITRFGAQVINGIGFLGAGTIIITGRQQVKGLTTAAGLWASACIGLAIGSGFYMGALVGCIFILITIIIFSRLETFILSHSRNINIFVECENIDDVARIVQRLKEYSVKIFDVEINNEKINSSELHPTAIFTLRLPKRTSHAFVMAAVAEIDTVLLIEEL